MDDAHVAGLETTVVAENWSGRLDVRSGLDGRGRQRRASLGIGDLANRHLQLVEQGAVDDESVCLVVETNQSHVRIAVAARTRALVNGEPADCRDPPPGGGGLDRP